MNNSNYLLGIVMAAVDNGLDIDINEPFLDIFDQAYNYLMDKEISTRFVHANFESHGHNQSYTFVDDATGYTKEMSGEIFDFTTHSDNVFFRRDDDGEFTPVKWYDVPAQGEERSNYIFVFAKEILSDGTVAYMYDYLQ